MQKVLDRELGVYTLIGKVLIHSFLKMGAADGWMVHDMHVMQVKTPEESKYLWDYYEILKTILGDEAFGPLAESDCLLIK